MSSGTRSVVEELERVICSLFPDKRFELKKAVPMKDGWYQLTYLVINKSDTNYNIKFSRKFFRVRKNSKGTWDIFEGRE